MRPNKYARWRAATLISVYVLMGVHIAHWKIAGKTLAPLELNEVLYTLELGIVTAGFLFMLTAVAATAIFGRFFCGWGCHILALQDLCAWLLEKLHIRPRPIRSRVLLWVPLLAMLYMFVWPQAVRFWEGRPPPTLRVFSDADGWASYVTTDFWRNLPGPWVTALTFAVCGFAIVYVLGSRSFCTYACPYGAVFRLADRAAPGRIVAAGDCSQCGTCTAACSSHVRVHEELLKYGTVVNANCLKDLDCVSACPNEAVKFGFTTPPALRSWRPLRRIWPAFHFSAAEDVLMAAVFTATLLIFRGLYDAVPFLMTLGLGAITAYLALLTLRLMTRPDVRFNVLTLRRAGRLTTGGVAYVAAAILFAALAAHSGVIRAHEFIGHRRCDALQRAAHAGTAAPESTALAHALRPLLLCERWGLLRSPRLTQRIAWLQTGLGEQAAGRGEFERAAAYLCEALQRTPEQAHLHYNRGVMLATLGRLDEAEAAYRAALQRTPADADVCNNLALLLMQRGAAAEAEALLHAALASNAEHAGAHFNLARLLAARGDAPAAEPHLRRAAQIDPRFPSSLPPPP
ncbi:putative electron transport protein YccM [Phycisphaerae bacterium RAS1]|nr:putative electron transport protein YccM [Phycisphaerae bacterium RAS1]